MAGLGPSQLPLLRPTGEMVDTMHMSSIAQLHLAKVLVMLICYIP